MDEMDIFQILGETRPQTPPSPPLPPSMQPSLTLPLLALPLDIHCLILQYLCPHCCSAPSGTTNIVAYDRVCRDDLRALSVTCKAFRLVAQSFLAHRPPSHLPLRMLVAALESNPHLTAEVRELDLCLYQGTSLEDFEFLKQAAERLPTAARRALDFERVGDNSLARNAFAMRLLLALTSHPDALTLRIRELRNWDAYHEPELDEEYDSYDEDSDDGNEESDEDTGANQIEDVIIEERPVMSASDSVRNFGRDSLFEGIRRLTLDHHADGSAFCFSHPPLPSILAATFNLRHLKIRNAVGGNLRENYASIDFRAEQLAPALQNLETLEIEDCAFSDASETSELAVLAKIIACAPKLHTFKFCVKNHQKPPHYLCHTVPPDAVLSAILPRRETLKHISLEFSDAQIKDTDRKRFELGKFTALKSLMIDKRSICPCVYNYWDPPSTDSCLFRAISAQLEHLYLLFDSMDWSRGHVEHLAEQVSIGRLPMLKRVTLVNRLEFEREGRWRLTKGQRYSLYQGMAAEKKVLEEAGLRVNFAGRIFHMLKAERSEEFASVEVVDV